MERSKIKAIGVAGGLLEARQIVIGGAAVAGRW